MIFKQLFWWVPFGRVPEISSKDLYAKLKNGQGPYILDVRSPGEWRTSHIDGSVNIPVTSLKREINNLNIPLERPVVTICLSAHRSIPAVRLLNLAGFNDARQLQGGMQAWWRAGLPVKENT
jgi:rhodanese-related sulfurtransferase